MCGRYTLVEELQQVGDKIKLTLPELPFKPRYNISPSQRAPVLLVQDDSPTCQMLRWGLIPFWAKDESIAYKTINARAETVAEKPTYRAAFKQRRCLILADGFYEWAKVGKAKVPHRFLMQSGRPFAFAGLWERWEPPQGDELLTFSLITTVPNEVTGKVHDRMPVILPPEKYEQWLDPKFSDKVPLQALLVPYPGAAMKSYEVGPIVNNARNELAQCIESAKEILFGF